MYNSAHTMLYLALPTWIYVCYILNARNRYIYLSYKIFTHNIFSCNNIFNQNQQVNAPKDKFQQQLQLVLNYVWQWFQREVDMNII